MVYFANIPQATDKPSQSQAQIASNFSDLDTVFNDNHIGFSQADDRGEHRKVTFNSIIADPAEADPKATLYTKTIGGDSELFYEKYDNAAAANLVSQMTGIATTNTGTNYSFDPPWDLEIRFGTFVCATAGTAVTFDTAFTTAAYCLFLTAQANNGSRNAAYQTLTVNGFTGYSTNNGLIISYIAIGH